MSIVLMRSLLITGLLSGLVVNYSPQKVLGIENQSSPILMLAQADPSTISIKDLSQKANELDAEIGQLNLKLKQVIKEEIDISEINFKLSKDKFKQFKEQWEQWKQSLSKEQKELLKEKIDKTDQYLTRLEGVINPLTADIIPTKEQFQASPETPLPLNRDLKVYQEKLFGENANPSDIDGVFGSGTQAKIESILNESVKTIETKLSEINGVVGVQIDNNPKESKDSVNDLQSEIQRLKEENQRLKTENQKLKSQISTPSVSPSPPPSSSVANNSKTTPTLPNTRNLSFLILPIILGILGVMVLGIYRQSRMSRKMKRSMSRHKTQLDDKRTSTTSIIESDHFIQDENTQVETPSLSTQTYYYPSYSLDSYDTENMEKATQTSSPKKSRKQRKKTTPKVDTIDLSSIDNEDDLVKVYNNYRQVFEQEIRNPQIIEMVTVDKESVEDKRLGRGDYIIFTPSRNGNYFIFGNFSDENGYYYLLPHPKLIVNSYNYETVNEVLECKNYERKRSNDFILRQAAIVGWTDKGIWLHEPGIIDFK